MQNCEHGVEVGPGSAGKRAAAGRRNVLGIILMVLIAIPLVIALMPKMGQTDLVGQVPPALPENADWLSGEQPDQLALQGQVVWLEFSFLT